MTADSDLARLADLAGIVPGYRDAWGNDRYVPEPTQRSLLSAMGLPVEDREQIAHSIREIEEAPFRRILDPVLVVRRVRGERIHIPISLPLSSTGSLLEWRFEMESGSARGGRSEFGKLSPLEQREVGGEIVARRALTLSFPVPLGYHRFRLFLPDGGEQGLSLPVIVVPSRCYLPRPDRDRGALWGMAMQLYGLCSERNWGIGDFTDLSSMVGMAARLGASAIGLNPLHALFPENPLHASPYSPSHRQYLSVSYLDVEAVADFDESEEARALVQTPAFCAALEELRQSELVDYGGVAAAKRPILEAMYRSFRQNHLGNDPQAAKTERGATFRRFQHRRGRSLEDLALFQALSAHFGSTGGWRNWPGPYRDPRSAEVTAFAADHREETEFFVYLQWQADLQLSAAAAAAAEGGMGIGLYHDLALAPADNGAEAWANQSAFAQGVQLGAPPDDWNLKGQNWGLPPYDPRRLAAMGYAPFSAVIRANMDHAGALRIDHAMSLERLYWIPGGAAPEDGGYVRYPVDDLIGILALESRRERCLVIGEDLGTVSNKFQKRMRAAAMLSYRLLYFSQDDKGRFVTPRRYPVPAAVTVGTHDLATLAGFWQGRDLEVRTEIGLYSSEEQRAAAVEERAKERRALIRALKREALLPDDFPVEHAEFSFELVTAVYRFLARSRSRLLLLNPNDVLGEEHQINVPGTTSEHPNWMRKMAIELERLEHDPRMVALAAAIAEERRRVGQQSRRGGSREKR